MVLGTPEYMSPEQATGQETDHRVDMYALGCILYEMLTGDVPFKGENAPQTLTKHVFEAVVPPSQLRADLGIPPVLEAVVMKLLEKKPGDRYSDMRELIGALEEAERAIKAGAPQPRRLEAAPSPSRLTEMIDVDAVPRSRGPLYAGAILGVTALVALTIALWHRTSADAIAKPAPTVAGFNGAPAHAPVVPVPTPPPAAEVQIQVKTVPPGAEVLMGTESLGRSPVDVHRPRADGMVTFTVKRAGFKDVTRDVMLDRDQMIELTLPAKREKLAVRSTHPTPNREGGKTPAQPKEKQHTSDLRNPFE